MTNTLLSPTERLARMKRANAQGFAARPKIPGQSASSAMKAGDLASWRARRMLEDPKKWTQEGAAEWFGVAVRSWRRWESGQWPIPRTLYNRIAERDALTTLIQHMGRTMKAMQAELQQHTNPESATGE